MDDVAIGGGAGASMAKTSAETADHSGPLETRILSKNWNVRAQAYEDLNKLSLEAVIDSKENFFQIHVDQWKVYLKDTNPGALEKALGAMVNFLNKIQAKVLLDAQNGIIQIIIEKMLLTHAKPGIKAKSLECLLLLFEVTQNFDDSIDTLQTLLKHKNVKVLSNAVLALAALVENYGVKKVKIAEYAEIMIKNAQNTNPDCKKNSYAYYKAVYKWIGEAIVPQIEDKLKKAQLDDLKKLFEEQKASGDKTKRLTRKEKKAEEERKKNEEIDAAIAAEEGGGAAAEGDGAPKEEEVIDALEFAPVKDILADFSPEWMEKVAAMKKWNEKKDELDKVVEACKNVKVKPGNFGPMAHFLNKEIRATNVNTSMAAIQVVTAIATGLKKDFAQYAKEVVEGVLLKYKEKRPMVQEACNNCCDALINSCNMEDISENVIPCITNIAPGVKNGTIKFVEKHALTTYIDILQRVSDNLLPAVSKVVEDKDGTVRDNAIHCMGVLKGRLGEAIMGKFIKDLNPQKTEKLNEAAKEIKPSKYDRPENWKPPVKKKAPVKKVEESKDEDGDVLMNETSTPRRKPPNIGKKPPSKKKPAADSSMVDEKKPAAEAAPKKVATAASTKGPTAPIIADENLGAGMDADQANEIVSANFDSATVKAFSAAKWQDKMQGFEGLQNEIKEKQFEAKVLEAVAVFIKKSMKDYKESNINLQKGTVATFKVMAEDTQALSKRAINGSMQFFTDKIGDVKLSVAIKEMLALAAELVTPNFIANQIIKYAATAKAPNTIKDSCNFITQMIEEFGPMIPLKETIDFAKVAAAHATPAVRQAAMKLFKEVYKHVGDVLLNFMNEIKESTRKLIDAELKQVTQYGKGEHEPTRQLRGAAAEAAAAKGGGKKGGGGGGGGGGGVADILESLPRQDISKKLTSKLLEQYGHKDWKVRKKAGDDIEGILKEAGMRIEVNGTNELMDVMKKAMKDANKAVLKHYIVLLGMLAEAMGQPINKYQKKCFVPMLSNLSDKQSLVRDEVVKCMNKWADAIGAEKVINLLGEVIQVENPEARNEGLKWILLHESSISNCDASTLVKPLIACLGDKSKGIRELAEQVGRSVMAITGHPQFLNATKDRPQAVQQTLKPILERIKAECGGGSSQPEPAKPAENKKAKKEEDAPPQLNSFARKKKQEEDDKPIQLVRKKVEDDSGITIQPTNRRKREQQDAKTKYPLNEVKGDHVERLQEECYKIFGQKFSDLMFTKNTEFVKHIKCVEQIDTCIDSQPGELMEILDIIFKWGNFRMSDSSNTKLVGAFFDFYQKLMNFLINQDYQMAEFEIVVLLGTLCDKTGQNIKIMAEKARQLAEMCYQVYEPKLCFKMIMQHGVGSKNLKAVAESLDMIAAYVKSNGVDTITKKDFAVFLERANSSDKNVRENSLRVFAEVYKVLKEDIWRLLGKDVNVKVKGLLEQRFKQVATQGAVTNDSSRGPGGNNNSSRGGPSALQKSNGARGLNPAMKSGGGSRGPQQDMNSSMGRSGGLKFNPHGSKGMAPAAVDDLTEKMKNQNIEADEPKFAQQPQQSPRRGDPEDEVPIADNRRDVQMQDVFSGKAPITSLDQKPAGITTDPQQDVMMEQEKSAPDEAAVVVSEKQNQRPVVDLDQALNLAEMQMETDPELREHMDGIQKHIDQLKVGDLLKRVDSLVALNEVISATSNSNDDQNEKSANKMQQKALIRLCDHLINAFSQVMVDIFSFPVKEIPLRFTKYFITIVNKTCSSKEIMKEVSCNQVQGLVDQLLQRLLIDNLDKIGQNKEGELILKNLNSSMLRMLENCNHTYIFVVLFGLLTKYKDSADQPKIPSLIIKCLLKLSKNMDKLIEKVDLKRFMVAIHEYLVTIPLDKKSQNDDLGTRIAKTLVNEIVKLKRNEIWEYYQVIEQHAKPDNHLQKWIQIILKSLAQNIETSSSMINNVNDINQSGSQGQTQQGKMYTEFEMKKIVQDLKDGNNYTHAIQRLDKFIKANPNFDWKKSLVKEGLQFTQRVSSDLEKFRKGQLELSFNNTSHISGMNTSQSNQMSLQERMAQARDRQNDLNNSMNKQDAFKSKMNRLTNQRSSVIAQPVGGLSNNQSTQNALNTSISEMNRNLSNKWAQINQNNRGGLTGRDTLSGSNTLANTMRNTTTSAPGQGNLLNTSSGGFKNRLQNKFANKQSNPNNSSQGADNAGAETGTIGQKASPSKIGGMQQVSSQAQLNRSSNAGGISNKSFRDRLKGIKSAQTNQTGVGPGLANTQNVPVGPIGGGAATNQDLQKRLADMKAKLHGLRNTNQ